MEFGGYGVGFLGDTRRMNVAVTRAKSALWILGNEESLLKNPVWRRLVADAKQRHCYTDCKPGQLNNLIRNGDQAAHQEKRKFEDDDQSGRKKKKPKSRDDRRVDNRQRNDFNKTVMTKRTVLGMREETTDQSVMPGQLTMMTTTNPVFRQVQDSTGILAVLPLLLFNQIITAARRLPSTVLLHRAL